MTSVFRRLPWLLVVVALLLGAAPRAQDGFKTLIPEKIERATTTDDKGMQQWAEWKDVKCPACSGKGKIKCPTCERHPDESTKCPDCNRSKEREAICHACGGTGQLPDPLEKALCPGCLGCGSIVCSFCPGSGLLKLGEDAKWSACPACRGKGFEKCAVCNGARFVEMAALKPSLKEANAAALTKALTTTDETLKAVGAFTPEAKNSRKEIKELLRVIALGQQLYPALKRVPKAADERMATAFAGTGYQGQAEREAGAMNQIKNGAEYYLKHQKRMLELAKKRAEANEKLAAESKPK